MRIVLVFGADDFVCSHLTELLLEKMHKVKVTKLSGKFGSYNAILAGMNYATGDCNVILAADLQDPPELIVKMYEYWVKLIIANRQNR